MPAAPGACRPHRPFAPTTQGERGAPPACQLTVGCPMVPVAQPHCRATGVAAAACTGAPRSPPPFRPLPPVPLSWRPCLLLMAVERTLQSSQARCYWLGCGRGVRLPRSVPTVSCLLPPPCSRCWVVGAPRACPPAATQATAFTAQRWRGCGSRADLQSAGCARSAPAAAPTWRGWGRASGRQPPAAGQQRSPAPWHECPAPPHWRLWCQMLWRTASGTMPCSPRCPQLFPRPMAH